MAFPQRLLLMACLAFAGGLAAQPQIQLTDVASNPIAHMGNLDIGDHSELTFQTFLRIQNIGDADLGVDSNIAFNPSNCVIAGFGGSSFPTTVQPGNNVLTFVSLSLNAQGPFSVEFSVTSDDPATPVYSITLSGNTSDDPNIRVGIPGIATSVGHDGVQNIGSAYPPMVEKILAFRVTDYAVPAAQPLNFDATDAVDVETTTNCDIDIPADPSGAVNAGAFVEFGVGVTPNALGPFSFKLRIYTDDPDTPIWTATFNGTSTDQPLARVHFNPDTTLRPHLSNVLISGAQSGIGLSIDGRVNNDGTATLNLTGSPLVDFTSETNCSVALTTPPPTTAIAPAADSGVFTIEVTPASDGSFSFDLEIESNDPSVPTYIIHCSGTATSAPPQLSVLLGGLAKAHDSTLDMALATPDVDFDIVGSAQNTGGQTLNLTGSPRVAFSAKVNCDVVLTSAPAPTVPVGGSSAFVVTVTALDYGDLSFDITVESNDPSTASYVIHCQGTTVPQPPTLVVLIEGTVRAHNASLSLTGAAVSVGLDIAGALRNDGEVTLDISNAALTLKVNCEAVFSTAPVNSVDGGDETAFTITVTPAAGGDFSFTLSVASNDPDRPTYLVNFSGTIAGPTPGSGGGDDSGGCSARRDGHLAAMVLPLLAGLIRTRKRRKVEQSGRKA